MLSTAALPTSSRTVRSAPGFSVQARQTEPFAAVPHRLADDLVAGRILPGDLAILWGVLYWARDRHECDPTVPQIAKRTGQSDMTIRSGLKRLAAIGLIGFRDDPSRPANRRILLLWRSQPPTQKLEASPTRNGEALPRKLEGGASPKIGPSGEVVVVEKVETIPGEVQTPEKCLSQRQRPEPPTGETPPPSEATAPDLGSAPSPPCQFLASLTPAQRERLASESSFKRGPVLRQFAEVGLTPEQREAFDGMMPELKAKVRRDLISGDPEVTWKGFEAILRNCKPASRAPRPDDLPTLDLIAGKDSDPTFPLALANRLSVEFRDSKSFRGFEAKLKIYPPEALVDAYQQAKNPKAKKPGAIFMHALKRHEEA